MRVLGLDPTNPTRIALAHGKANGTPLGPTISFEMVGGGEGVAPKLAAVEVIDADANAVCRPARDAPGRPPSASEAAEEFILEVLSREPLTWKSIEADAEARSIASPRTLVTIRTELAKAGRIRQVGRGRNAKWRLKA